MLRESQLFRFGARASGSGEKEIVVVVRRFVDGHGRIERRITVARIVDGRFEVLIDQWV